MDYSALNALIEYLRQKRYITDLERDILDTANELQKDPFDMDSAESQVTSNDTQYPKISTQVKALPTTVQKPRRKITETDLRYILTMQLSGLIAKESEEIQNVQ